MTAKEYLEKELDFEDGWFVEEVYPSQIAQWMEDYHKIKLNNLSLQNVSERDEVKRKLDEEFTHYEPTMCDGTATMRECENGTYIERDDAHLIIDKHVR